MVLSSMQLQKVSVTLWFRRLQCLVLRSVLSVFINLRSAECVCSTMDFVSADKQTNKIKKLQFQNRDSSADINISDIVQHSRWIVNVEPISSPLSEEVQTRCDVILAQNSGLAASVM